MTNNTMNNDNKKGAKYIFDKISLGALKVEMVLMVGVMLTCAFKITTTFLI